jgi:hypothetical protein
LKDLLGKSAHHQPATSIKLFGGGAGSGPGKRGRCSDQEKGPRRVTMRAQFSRNLQQAFGQLRRRRWPSDVCKQAFDFFEHGRIERSGDVVDAPHAE